jgi:hypothetical protein
VVRNIEDDTKYDQANQKKVDFESGWLKLHRNDKPEYNKKNEISQKIGGNENSEPDVFYKEATHGFIDPQQSGVDKEEDHIQNS